MSAALRATCTALLLSAVLSSCYKPRSEGQPLGSEANPIVMSFVTSTEAEGIMDSADELTHLLETETGLHFSPNRNTSYVGIVEAMGVGQVQVGWLPPVAYLYARQRSGVEPLFKVVRKGSSTYRGQIVVMADSPLQALADLRGQRVAFPEQTSASGYYYPVTLLREQGIDPELDLEVSFAGGHDQALLALINGQAEAACCYEDAREKLVDSVPGVLEKTRILAYTASIPADNVSVAPELDLELRGKLQAGLAAVAASEAGKAALKALYDIDGLEPAADADYDPVRQMMAALGQDLAAEVRKQDEKLKKN